MIILERIYHHDLQSKIRIAITETPWGAVTHEQNIEAESMNQLIDKSLDQYDIECGTRILEIYAYIKDEAIWKKVW